MRLTAHYVKDTSDNKAIYKIVQDTDGYIVLDRKVDPLINITIEEYRDINFSFNTLFFVQGIPHIKVGYRQGIYPIRYTLNKNKNRLTKRVVVDSLQYKVGDTYKGSIITSIGSRWKQKKSGRILEYLYFDIKKLHRLYLAL